MAASGLSAFGGSRRGDREMDENSRLDEALRSALGELSRAKGACPTREDLARYHSLDPGDERSAAIRTHTLRCPSCDLVLDRLDRFERVVHDAAGARGAIERGLQAEQRSPLSRYWKPVLAGAVAAAVLMAIPLFRGLRVAPPTLPAPADTVQLAEVFVIPQDRAGSPTLRLSQGASTVVLSFFAPMSAGKRYAASIDDARGGQIVAPVDISSHSATGQVNLAANARLFRPGSYVLRVTESGGLALAMDLKFTVER